MDAAPANQLANYAGVDATSFTQEFRINGETEKSRWVASLFYLTIDNTSDNGLKAPSGSIINTLFGAPFNIGVVSELQTDSYSIFGQFEFDLHEDLTLTAAVLDATVKDVPLRAFSTLPARDVDPTYAPPFQASAIARYE